MQEDESRNNSKYYKDITIYNCAAYFKVYVGDFIQE